MTELNVPKHSTISESLEGRGILNDNDECCWVSLLNISSLPN